MSLDSFLFRSPPEGRSFDALLAQPADSDLRSRKDQRDPISLMGDRAGVRRSISSGGQPSSHSSQRPWYFSLVHLSLDPSFLFTFILELFSETSYLPFLGDDFLRLLVLRFIFCCVALRLHRAFKHWPALLPRAQPPLPENELLLQPSLERAMYTLIDHLELSSVFIEPREIL